MRDLVRARRRWVAALLACGAALLGAQDCVDQLSPTLPCELSAISLDPGTCVEISNPCGDGTWSRLDSFRLCDAPAGLSTRTKRNPRAHFLCADASIAPLAAERVQYRYVRPGDLGEGAIEVTVGPPIEVEATASPTTITEAGGTSQLDAVVSAGGTGVPPYTYLWIPANLVDDATSPSTTTSPSVSTTYVVRVTDAQGQVALGGVTVFVGVGASASSSPAVIPFGGSADLVVTPEGGVPPYTFDWSPAGSLDDPTSATPTATPASSTPYEVVVTDALGATARVETEVQVELDVAADATPPAIAPGGSAQLEAEASGGLLPLHYHWSPGGSLDDPLAATPEAMPSADTTYEVVVTDAAGFVASDQVTVDVLGAAEACFDLTELDPSTVDLDPGCSDGLIVEYRWWQDFQGSGQPPDRTELEPCPDGPANCVLFTYATSGEKTIRLEVEAADGETDATTMLYTVP